MNCQHRKEYYGVCEDCGEILVKKESFVKLLTFDAHFKEKMKDPEFKAGYVAWTDAIETEIKPRDKKIEELLKERDDLVETVRETNLFWKNFGSRKIAEIEKERDEALRRAEIYREALDEIEKLVKLEREAKS